MILLPSKLAKRMSVYIYLLLSVFTFKKIQKFQKDFISTLFSIVRCWISSLRYLKPERKPNWLNLHKRSKFASFESWKLKLTNLLNFQTVGRCLIVTWSFVCHLFILFQAVVLITRLDFLHVQILKARRTWSMTRLGMKTRREGAQKMKMIELPLAIINTTRISLHKDQVFHEHNSRGSLC